MNDNQPTEHQAAADSAAFAAKLAAVNAKKYLKLLRHSSYWIFRAFTVLLLAPVFCGETSAQSIAETFRFAVNGNKIPTSATTKYFEPLWTKGDATNTAHHELLHAIGFTNNYEKFKEHVDGNLNFRESTTATGKILAKLTGAAQGTHTDPKAGEVNGFDQAKSVMQPSQVTGQRMGGQEKSVENAGFDWSSKNIKITVTYSGTWTAAQKAHVADAVAKAKALFGSDGTGHEFKWTVELGASSIVAGEQLASTQILEDFVSDLSADKADKRVASTALVLSKGVAALPALRDAGAKPMSGLQPRRLDVIYSILSAEREARFRTDEFGLHVEPGTGRADILAMGERHGFILPDGEAVDAGSWPSCYVRLREGRDLWDVLGQVLAGESKVLTVNLNYVEP
jgi:hypothetical protein